MAAQIAPSHMSSGRVIPANPVRFQSGLNYDRCAALHNELLEHGWTGSGKSLDALERKTWFDFHGEEAEGVRNRLSAELVAFLERALVVDESDHLLFCCVGGLSYPDYMWTNHQDEKSSRFLTLYAANDIAEHPDGVVFDRKENKAIMQMSIHDSGTTRNGRQQWYPLEVILSAWLDMVDTGKIQAVHCDIDADNGKYDPWINLPWSAAQLEEATKTFNLLVDSIETRVPDAVQPPATGSEFLLSEVDLDAAHIPPGFARSFLSKAKRPRFHYIAPGLSVPDSTSFLPQPFSSVESDPPPDDDQEIKVVFPILLFRSSQSNHAHDNDDDDDTNGSGMPFSWPYNQVRSYPAGLYFTDSDREAGNEFEDGVRLVLPFGIGSNGVARTSDGAPFVENKEAPDVEPKDTHADLYQPGYRPFVEMHEVRLVKVLQSWIGIIERGDWRVGSEGVQGSIDEFRQADIKEGWTKFVVPLTW